MFNALSYYGFQGKQELYDNLSSKFLNPLFPAPWASSGSHEGRRFTSQVIKSHLFNHRPQQLQVPNDQIKFKLFTAAQKKILWLESSIHYGRLFLATNLHRYTHVQY
jgi:hypothetical protein